MAQNIKELAPPHTSPSTQAMELLKLAVGTNPQSYHSWYLLGRCHNDLGNERESFIAYHQALKYCPSTKTQSDIYSSIG